MRVIRKGFLIRGSLAFLLAFLSGQELSAATKHHRVAWDSSPSSEAIIAFSPDGTSVSPSIEYGFTTDESSWTSLSGLDQATFDGTLVSHFGRLTGLPADSAVYYRVCDQDGCGQRYWFKTAPGVGNTTPFVVVAGGDTRTGWDTRRQGNALIAKIRPLFIMHGGDYTNANNAVEMDQLLEDWVLTYSNDTIDGYAYKRIYPIIPTHGNHENGEYNTLCKVFGVDFNQNGSCEVADTYDTYGATQVSPLLRVYTLNSEFRDLATSHFGDMNSWLSSDLAANGSTATWRFAQYHKPMFPHFTGKSENPDLFAAWSGNFYSHAMNLVVESDTHMMKLTGSLEPSGSTFVNELDGSATGGTVYVGEGSWGAPARSADDPKSWTIDLASIQQIKVIAVFQDRLEVRTALFDDTATALTREERTADPVRLPNGVNWWGNNGVGEVLDLKRHATTRRSVIDEAAEFSRACDQVLCEFTDMSAPGVSSIESWSWDFGDGTQAGVQHPHHGYGAGGKYNVTLRVTDDAGIVHVYGQSVDVAKTSGNGTVDVQIAHGDDDVEQGESGYMYFSSSDLELVYDTHTADGTNPQGNQTVGLRFSNINVPQAADINTAHLAFTADESDSSAAGLEFRAEDVDNASTFSSTAGDVSARLSNATTASTQWTDVPAWSTGTVYNSPDLAPVVEEVTGRPGWSAGNSMVFLVTGDPSSQRVAESYNGVAAAAPALHIEYTDTTTPPCTANRIIPAHEWVGFALPCDPGSSNTVEDIFTVFAGLDALYYNSRWVLFRFDPAAQSYQKLALTDHLNPGHGYWVYSIEDTVVNYTGVANMTGDLGLETDTADGKWNFVGFTGNLDKAWVDFMAYNGSTLVDIPAADAINDADPSKSECQLSPPSDKCLVSRTGYVWNGGNYDPYDALVPGLDDDIEPGHAVWVKAFKPGTMLRIEPTAAPASTGSSAAAPAPQSVPDSKVRTEKAPGTGRADSGDWFIRLVAESGSLADRSNVFGQLENSRDDLDLYDVEELAPFGHGHGNRYLSLAFENDGLTGAEWGYTSDYRAMTKKPGGTWLFLVRASSDVQQITLRWEGDDKLLRNASLRDEQTGQEIRIRPGESYQFQNSPGGNWFSWIMKGSGK